MVGISGGLDAVVKGRSSFSVPVMAHKTHSNWLMADSQLRLEEEIVCLFVCLFSFLESYFLLSFLSLFFISLLLLLFPSFRHFSSTFLLPSLLLT
jgi:hypothetical protein